MSKTREHPSTWYEGLSFWASMDDQLGREYLQFKYKSPLFSIFQGQGADTL